MSLSKLHIEKEWIKDEKGRTMILRGVNLGGDSKVPYPDGGTHYPSDFSGHRDVSFIGRPFPAKEADEHFSRLKSWGFNVLRLLTTWEAIEHKGPYAYDEDYLDYYAGLCDMAGSYGMYVIVDFHQDVWSRMSGGDGAPCWLFEKIGLDYTTFGRAAAALVMQYAYDYANSNSRQHSYPPMCWQSNYGYPVNGIMWSLFFAGNILTPLCEIKDEHSGQNVNVQDYMQGHFLGCMARVADRLKNLSNVIGFDTLNEPSKGWIGMPMNFRHVKMVKHNPPKTGIVFSPVDALYVSHGYSMELPFNGFSLFKGGIGPVKTVIVNPDCVSIWFDNKKDPFMQAGAWTIDDAGNCQTLRNDFFQKTNDKEIDFNEHCLAPFWQSAADTIRKFNADWIIFAEKESAEGMLRPGFPQNVPENTVNASHWYDGLTLMNKKFRNINIDIVSYMPALGLKGIEKKYIRELGRIKSSSERINGGAPTLIGEFGIPFDLDDGNAYKKYAQGDYSSKPWNNHITALDLMYNAMDYLLIHSTQWNYAASNSNDLKIGDGWNQEDLSIYSSDQRNNPGDITSGGRAMEGWLRPFARYVQGVICKMTFNRGKGVFSLVYLSEPDIQLPTEIFVPAFQYPEGYTLKTSGADIDIVRDTENNTVTLFTREKKKISVILTRK